MDAADVNTGSTSQRVVPISQAAASQRAGRAGRTAPDTCFRLCTEAAPSFDNKTDD